MSSQFEKLKKSINTQYTKNFEINLMKSSGFIPVDKKQSEIFVILNKNNLSNKPKVEDIIKNTFVGLIPKFIPIESSDFDNLISYVNDFTAPKTTAEETKQKDEMEPSAEEMLVTIGWLTQAQLDECITESKQNNEPLDLIFHKKNYLSYERIVSYLKKKY